MSKELKLGRQRRVAIFDKASAKPEERTIDVSFSSEEPCERWWGVEVLGHKAGEADLDWLNGGTAPMLKDHRNEVDNVVGVIEKAWLGNDQKGHARVRFGSDQASQELFKKVQDGIVVNVSVGYEVLRLKLVEENKDKPSVYRVTNWRPLEASFVAIPADMTVGVGRAEGDEAKPIPIDLPERAFPVPLKETRMSETTVQPPPVNPEAILAAERQRTADIETLAQRHNMADLGREHIKKGSSIELFRGVLLDKIGDAKPLYAPQGDLGLSQRELGSFSMVKALAAQAFPHAGIKVDFERECSAEIAKRMGVQPRGILMPYDVMTEKRDYEKRDLTVGTSSAGGYLVATELRPQDFIELLRNRMMVRQMGATVLSGLQGNVAFPKQSAAGTAYWLAEAGSITESQQTLAQVTLSPKTVGAMTDYSRQLLLQSSIAVENFVRNDLSKIIALAIDLAAIHGSGASNQPTGIVATSGIGSVAGGTDGLAPAWSHIVGLETAVANANADVGTLGYLTNSRTRGKLKVTEKASSTAQFIWGDGAQPLNGYKAGVSNQVSNTLVKGSSGAVCSAILFGDWSQLLIGEWGILDLFADPYISGDAGNVRIRGFMSTDIAIRTAASFAAMLDALSG